MTQQVKKWYNWGNNNRTEQRIMPKSIANKNRTKRLTAKQIAYLELYYNPYSETFGNAYKTAISVGYSTEYAHNITHLQPSWLLSEYIGNKSLGLEHISNTLAEVASLTRQGSDSDRIRALELLAKLQGLLVERKQVQQVIKVELGKVNADIIQVDTEQQPNS